MAAARRSRLGWPWPGTENAARTCEWLKCSIKLATTVSGVILLIFVFERPWVWYAVLSRAKVKTQYFSDILNIVFMYHFYVSEIEHTSQKL